MDSSKRDFILQAFRVDARGIFSRHESVESLCKCVRSVHEGQIWANSLPKTSVSCEYR
jgi:DNA-binding NarL/FixJ family response regulator